MPKREHGPSRGLRNLVITVTAVGYNRKKTAGSYWLPTAKFYGFLCSLDGKHITKRQR